MKYTMVIHHGNQVAMLPAEGRCREKWISIGRESMPYRPFRRKEAIHVEC